MIDPEDEGEDQGRGEVSTLKASRRGLKGVLNRVRRAAEQVITEVEDGDDPTKAEVMLESWKKKLQRYEEAEDKVVCHPASDVNDEDKDFTDQLMRFSDAETIVKGRRRTWDRAQEAAMAAAAPDPIADGGGGGDQQIRHLQRVDAKKPPMINDQTDFRSFMKWKPLWENYAMLVSIDQRPQRVQVGMLWELFSAGFLRTVRNAIGIPRDTNRPLNEIFELIERHLRSLRNRHLDMKELLDVRQKEGQDYTSLTNELKELSEYADAVNITEDILLIGLLLKAMSSDEDKAKVMERNPATFQDARRYILELETARKGARAMGSVLKERIQDDEELEMNRVSRKKSLYKKNKEKEKKSDERSECGKCGRGHGKDKCPANGQKCHKCEKVGHFAAKCFGKSIESNAVLMIGNVTKASEIEIPTTILKKERSISWKTDTGADCNIIGMKDLQKYGKGIVVKNDKARLTAPGGIQIKYKGKVDVSVKLNGKQVNTTAYVIPGETTALLGRKTCVKLDLIEPEWPRSRIRSIGRLSLRNPREGAQRSGKRKEGAQSVPKQKETEVEKIFKDFGNVFCDEDDLSPLPKMSGPPMKIKLKPEAKPVRHYRAAPIPFQWKRKVKNQLDAMEKKDIVEKVPIGEVPEWIMRMVIVPKAGTSEPRMTVDFKPMNPWVERAAHPCGTPAEEVAEIPPGMKYFTKLDSRHGYWQVPLDEESKKKMAFITEWGLYRYKRNAMGLINAGDEHNRRGDEALKGIKQVKKIVEDILIYDVDYESHIRRVRKVLERCKDHGITLSKRKCEIAKPEVTWCGYRITKEGYTANPDLVEALKNFPTPKNTTDARAFCGLVNQFEAMSAKLTELLEPIRALTGKKVPFLWEGPQEQAMKKTIEELTSPRVLVQYRQGAKLRLETDAAQKTGLGFALWQQEPNGTWRLLRCGSRSVTPAESRYSVTEVELLAAVWAIKKLKLYLRGNPFELIVDHQPLVAIVNHKGLEEIETPRVQRLKEKMSGYIVTATWRPGAEMVVVDTFSRYPVSQPTEGDLEGEEEMEDFAQQFTVSAIEHEDLTLKNVKIEAGRDPVIRKLTETIMGGFPKNRSDLDEELREFWKVRDGLGVVDGLVVYGTRVVIPKELRKQILEDLHASHQGREKTLARARQCVYWPGITRDIENKVKTCEECEYYKASNPKEPLVPDESPTRPGEAIACDLFQFGNHEYLVITDKYSGWAEVHSYGRGVGTGGVTRALGEWMAAMGVPVRLTSDGGPQFKSEEFQRFCEQWRINHDPSSPYHHQANGYAEAAVKNMKNLVKKTSPKGNVRSGSFLRGLLEWRNTPRKDGMSPAQRLFGRAMRTLLPTHPAAFAVCHRNTIRKADRKAEGLKKKAKDRYDAGARDLGKFVIGDVVRAQHMIKKTWDLIAEVMEVKPRGRSYLIRTETGRLYWRNRRYLRRYNPPESK